MFAALSAPELELSAARRLKHEQNLDLVLSILVHTFERFDDTSDSAKNEYFSLYKKIKEKFVEHVVRFLSGEALDDVESRDVAVLKVLRCFFSLLKSPARVENLSVMLSERSRPAKWMLSGTGSIGV